ncbi:secondary thiamine-phosphate synthase enzyme YjbQ [bacterium]|nr:secondary thiamine-phosphate synthase enzyme YjbQ [bacterium]
MVSQLMEINVATRQRVEMIDVTSLVKKHLSETGIQAGMLVAHVLHTTAGLTVNENADPDVLHDLLLQLETLAPNRREFRHGEGNSDAHVKSSLVGCSLTLPVAHGVPVLGTWQGIYFCEFDGPRQRKLVLRVMGD